MLWCAQRRGLGIYLALPLPHVSSFQNADTFSVSGHDAVLDAVMDHFDEVPGAVGSAMKVALLRRATEFLAARRARRIADARCKRSKDGIQTLNDFFFTADHHAIATFQAPDTAAGSHIQIMKT